jgi:hypothetical protein
MPLSFDPFAVLGLSNLPSTHPGEDIIQAAYLSARAAFPEYPTGFTQIQVQRLDRARDLLLNTENWTRYYPQFEER